MTHIAQMNARIASLSAALEQIAGMVTPGANSTNKKMGACAVAALEANSTPIEIVEQDRHSRPSANKNYFTVAQVNRTARNRASCDFIGLQEAEGGWNLTFDMEGGEDGFFKQSFVEGKLNHKAKEDWVVLLVRFADECEDEIDARDIARAEAQEQQEAADEAVSEEEVNEETGEEIVADLQEVMAEA